LFKSENPYQEIVYIPLANKFSATVGKKFLGYFSTLKSAIAARRAAINSTQGKAA
jgi:hypothetical protein